MESYILEFFNIKLDFFIVFVCVAFVVMLITLFFLLLDYLKIRKRYMEFMQGESGKNLEYTIYKRFRDIDQLQIDQKDNDDQIAIVYNKLRQSYSKLGLYHYDAYNSGLGGTANGNKMSFALTLLNIEDSGIILNCIHNRAGCHVYIKEINKGTSQIVLAEEEEKSLQLALNHESEGQMMVKQNSEMNEKI